MKEIVVPFLVLALFVLFILGVVFPMTISANGDELDLPRAYALAARIVAGHPLRYRSMVGKGKLLRRSEWDNIIAGEWVERGYAYKGTDRSYHPTPECVAFCERILPARARTGARSRTTGI